MEDNEKLIESLLERAGDYGKATLELVKLKAIDKVSETVSSFVPVAIVAVIIYIFLLFLNLGLAFWLGEILGKTFLGFLVVAGFYCITGVVVHFLLHKWLKRHVSDFIVKNMLK
jgi:hypothetical protein